MNINKEIISSINKVSDLPTDFNLTQEQFNQFNITVYSYEEFNSFGNLRNIEYSDFLSRFRIFENPSLARKYAQENGINLSEKEIHHIIDVAFQIKNYNELYGTSYSDRKIFEKEHKEFIDQRCIITTFFEHLLIHYLAAKDLGGQYIIDFYYLATFKKKKYLKEESLLNYLFDVSLLRENSRKNAARSTTGKKIYTNGAVNKYFSENDSIPEGFVLGSTYDYTFNLGCKMYNNGTENRFFKENEAPEGWALGKLFTVKDASATRNKGKEIYHKDGKNAYFYKDEVPKGWIKGASPTKGNVGRKTYHKDGKNAYFYEGEQPEGWEEGPINNLCNKGKKTYHKDGIIKCFYENEVPEGWAHGRPPKSDRLYTDGIVKRYFKPNEHIPDVYWKIEKDPQKQLTYYNDRLINISLLPGEQIPEGFKLGKIRTREGSSRGKKAYHKNGIVKYFFEGEQPEGWTLGNSKKGAKRSLHKKEKPKKGQSPSNKGKICYNNGIVNKYFNTIDKIPEGWVLGRLKRK